MTETETKISNYARRSATPRVKPDYFVRRDEGLVYIDERRLPDRRVYTDQRHLLDLLMVRFVYGGARSEAYAQIIELVRRAK